MASEAIGTVEAVVIDVSDLDRAVAFWSAVIGADFGASFEPQFRRAILPNGLVIVLQEANETKAGKNRVHIDVEAADMDAALSQVEIIGGRLVTRVENEFGVHLVCADPDGNEFCLT